jgi:membrane-associated phospholipid phosphatase
MDVSDRNQRKSLYFFVEGSLLLYLLYDFYSNNNIDLVMLFLLILLVIMQLSNYFIKSSMHTAFNIFVSALFFTLNPWVGIIWAGIAVSVGFTRIILKRHTVKEVFIGGLIAGFVSFVYLYASIHFQN